MASITATCIAPAAVGSAIVNNESTLALQVACVAPRAVSAASLDVLPLVEIVATCVAPRARSAGVLDKASVDPDRRLTSSLFVGAFELLPAGFDLAYVITPAALALVSYGEPNAIRVAASRAAGAYEEHFAAAASPDGRLFVLLSRREKAYLRAYPTNLGTLLYEVEVDPSAVASIAFQLAPVHGDFVAFPIAGGVEVRDAATGAQVAKALGNQHVGRRIAVWPQPVRDTDDDEIEESFDLAIAGERSARAALFSLSRKDALPASMPPAPTLVEIVVACVAPAAQSAANLSIATPPLPGNIFAANAGTTPRPNSLLAAYIDAGSTFPSAATAGNVITVSKTFPVALGGGAQLAMAPPLGVTAAGKVQLNGVVSRPLSNGASVSFWHFADSAFAHNGASFYVGPSADDASPVEALSVTMNDANTFCSVSAPGGFKNYAGAGGLIPTDSLWHNYACVFDGVNTVRIYRDGALVRTATLSGTDGTPGAYASPVGLTFFAGLTSGAGTTAYYSHVVAQLRAWSPTEIASLAAGNMPNALGVIP